MNKLAMTERWATRFLIASGFSYQSAKISRAKLIERGSAHEFNKFVLSMARIDQPEPRRRFARRFV